MPLKRRRRPVSSDRRFSHNAHTFADHGTPERWQHSGRRLELTGQAGLLAARATEEHIVDRLVLRGWLDKSQSEAAFKFKLDYQRASLAARVTSRYNPAAGARDFTGPHERSDFEEAAYRRWRNAVRALGIRFSEVVIAVVCHDIAPVPASMPRLQKGLSRLAGWYGVPESAAAQPSGQNIDQAAAR